MIAGCHPTKIGMCFGITRGEYNELVSRYPSWMSKRWPHIVRGWSLMGPIVDDRYYQRIMFLLTCETR